MASTLGVVVPPSLVLILLADAMMRAHTEAVNATGIDGGYGAACVTNSRLDPLPPKSSTAVGVSPRGALYG